MSRFKPEYQQLDNPECLSSQLTAVAFIHDDAHDRHKQVHLALSPVREFDLEFFGLLDVIVAFMPGFLIPCKEVTVVFKSENFLVAVNVLE